jgi:hypothetical protein
MQLSVTRADFAVTAHIYSSIRPIPEESCIPRDWSQVYSMAYGITLDYLMTGKGEPEKVKPAPKPTPYIIIIGWTAPR